MAVLDLIGAARDETFAARTAMCLTVAALNVANEDPVTTNHVNRLAFAQRVLKGEVNNKLIAAAALAYNGTLQSEINSQPTQKGANIPDSDLQFVINGLIDLLANAWAAAV
jgi:hypothetical protein